MPSYYSIMRTFALLMLAFASLHADDGAEARYVGGTSAAIKSDSDGKLSATDDLFLEFRCKGKELHVPYTNSQPARVRPECGPAVHRGSACFSAVHLEQEAASTFSAWDTRTANSGNRQWFSKSTRGRSGRCCVSLEARTGLKVAYSRMRRLERQGRDE